MRKKNGRPYNGYPRFFYLRFKLFETNGLDFSPQIGVFPAKTPKRLENARHFFLRLERIYTSAAITAAIPATATPMTA